MDHEDQGIFGGVTENREATSLPQEPEGEDPGTFPWPGTSEASDAVAVDATWNLDRMESRLLRSQRADRESVSGRLDGLEQRLADLDGRATALPGQLEGRLTVRLDALAERIAELDQRLASDTVTVATRIEETVSHAVAQLSAQVQSHSDTVQQLLRSQTDAVTQQLEATIGRRHVELGTHVTTQLAAVRDELAALDGQTRTTVEEAVTKLESRLLAADHGDRQRHDQMATRLDQLDAGVGELTGRLDASTSTMRRAGEEHRTERERLVSFLESMESQFRELPTSVERAARDVSAALHRHDELSTETQEILEAFGGRLDRLDTTLAARVPELLGRLRLGVVELDAAIEQLRTGLQGLDNAVERNDGALGRWQETLSTSSRVLETRLTEAVNRAANLLVDETAGSAAAVHRAVDGLRIAVRELAGVDATVRGRIETWEQRAAGDQRAVLEQLVQALAAELPPRLRRKVAERLLDTASPRPALTVTASEHAPDGVEATPAADARPPEEAGPGVRVDDLAVDVAPADPPGPAAADGEGDGSTPATGDDTLLGSPIVRTPTIRAALADLPGIGPARLTALVDRFGTLSRLASASVDDVASLRGISPETAHQIIDTAAEQFTPSS